MSVMDQPQENIELAKKSLGRFRDPETGRTFEKTGQLLAVELKEAGILVRVGLSTHSFPIRDEIAEQLKEHLQVAVPSVCQIDVEVAEFERPAGAIGQIGLTAKSVIAVGSGKGGVGKSTIAASIAMWLSRAGSKVGLMDADVYGPSIPHLLGLSGRPEVLNGKIQPIYAARMPVMSMGFMVDPNEAVIWRGPMLHGAIHQFLRDTYWGNLDYLIIDMPPGTGDIALTLSQLLPLSGAVVVCTPQEVALLDAVKAIAMFRKTKIPVLGMVENMSGFICPDNGKRYDIFGHGGARRKAEELQVPCLGEVPLNMNLRLQSDDGQLSAALDDPICGKAIDHIVRSIVRNLSDRAAKAPASPPLPVLG